MNFYLTHAYRLHIVKKVSKITSLRGCMQFKRNLAYAAFSLITCLSTSAVQALPIDYEIDVTNGYRQDRQSCLIKEYIAPSTLIGTDSLKARKMSIYQLGLEARVTHCNWYGNWLARADVDYGWGWNGFYNETFTTPLPATFSQTKAQINHVNVQDGTIGAGYLFILSNCSYKCLQDFAIGPVVGWSYNRQQFKLHEAITDHVADPVIDGMKYTEHWQGPWLGVDATWDVCCATLHAGYEYHWATWNATWQLAGPDTAGAFSDKRHSSNAYGQLAYLKIKKYIYCEWSISLGLKAQHWKAVNGSEKPKASSFADLGFNASEKDKVKNAKWQSFSATIDIGYIF